MRPHTFPITFLSVAGFAVACTREESPFQQLDNVKTETKEAAQDMKDHALSRDALAKKPFVTPVNKHQQRKEQIIWQRKAEAVE